ncbi:aldo/keto reductase [Breznakiella homolactica]|uniref:Aldo/keto reductase n=1 Tax=Breznakiella homolactica TaxID=2798577 RepID=A0A7T7XPE8_9SPIR|nr:aldo/keto reductase [Breznakiella homolactica]QQO10065.1 aldo/keto reductase [Breznakiella homolactica]
MAFTESKKLNTKTEIPYLGLGVFRSKEGDETYNSVRWALDAGYRHIDTAAFYGNEGSVGKAVRDSGIPRDEIFITTKLWNDDMRRGTQEAAFEKSLKNLMTDYLDLYLIHWPVPDHYVASYKILERLYKDDRCRAVGVSNFEPHHLDTLMKETSLVPAVNQVELHPLLNQQPLLDYCASHGIALTAWSPLGGTKVDLPHDPVLTEIGRHYGKSAVQVIIRWNIQRGVVVIPKSSNQQRIIENGQVFDFELNNEDMAKINSMNKNERFGSDPDNFNF